MEKFKKLLLLLFVAILGGLVSVFSYRMFEGKSGYSSDGFFNARKASYDIKNITAPTFDFADVSEAVTPTVVHIKTVSNQKSTMNNQPADPFDLFGQGFNMPPQGPQMASGSGVIISRDGYIVTNNHVVADADNIEVVLYDKRSFKAEIVGRDPNTDIALIKINADDLSAIKIGNSDKVRIGEWVLAVGNPFNLTSTVTAGIVSAKARNIQLLGGGTSIESFIQTDAVVNPGNSGGALVNTKGELIGINSAIASHSGQYEGYSFAVPVSIMQKVVDDIMKFGEVQRGFIGVQIQDVNAEIAKEKGMDRPHGVLVQDVTDGGAAESAGIKKGDVITKVDVREINSSSELQEAVGRHHPGDAIKVTVLRNSKELEIPVKLRTKDNKLTAGTSSPNESKKELGASFENLGKDLKAKLKVSNGVQVSSIDKGRIRNAGIPEGFVIISIDKIKIYSSSDVYKAIQGKKGGLMVEGYMPTGEKKYYVLDLD